jgi:hypothetical protein
MVVRECGVVPSEARAASCCRGITTRTEVLAALRMTAYTE